MWNISGLTDLCVPLFFTLSGFLFFINFHASTGQDFFKKKIQKRISSLLIPYLIANAITLFMVLPLKIIGVSQSFLESLDFLSIIKCLTIDPIDSPLWFIRDLMFTVLLSPLLYHLLKRTNGFVLLLLAIVWIVDGDMDIIPGFLPKAIFFFSVGAYVSLKWSNLIIFPRAAGLVSSVFALLLFLLYSTYREPLIGEIYIIIAIPAVIYYVSVYIKCHSIVINKEIVAGSFFVYLYHGFLCVIVKRLFIQYIHPQSDLSILIVYLSTFIITVLFVSAVYIILKKLMPKTVSYMVGGR